jgi:hypothetical protein
VELVAERGIDGFRRTVLRWVQPFGPFLAAEIRTPRRPLGTKGAVDAVCFFRGTAKYSLYRAVDEHGQVADVLFRAHRDTASAGIVTLRRFGAVATERTHVGARLANASPLARGHARHRPPLGKPGLGLQHLAIVAGREAVPAWAKVGADRAERDEEVLRVLGRFEALEHAFSSPGGPMRVFRPIVQPFVPAMLYLREHRAQCWRIVSQLVGDHHPWRVPAPVHDAP